LATAAVLFVWSLAGISGSALAQKIPINLDEEKVAPYSLRLIGKIGRAHV